MRSLLRRRAGITVALVVAFGLIASFVSGWGVRRSVEAEARAELEQDAQEVVRDVEVQLAVILETLTSLPQLFASSEAVTRTQYRTFCRSALERHPDIRMLMWMPVVDAGDRELYEERARSLGLTDFEIVDLDASGRRVPAPQRDIHVPLVHIYPESDDVLGLDQRQVHHSVQFIDEAVSSGEIVASAPHTLTEDPEGPLYITFYAPLYTTGTPPVDPAARRQRIVGLAAMIIPAGSKLDEALAALERDDVEVQVRAATIDGDVQVMHETDGFRKLGGNLEQEVTASLAGRKVQLIIRAPGSTIWDGMPAVAIGFLATGLVAGILLVIFTLIQANRRSKSTTRLGKYTLLRKLGEGGMGQVYQAQHAFLRRRAAIKVIRPEIAQRAMVDKFRRELRILSALHHPNIVSVYDYGRGIDGTFYFTMEYIEGKNLLLTVLQEGAQPSARAAHVMRQIASALAAAHDKGLVHRDLKPDNVMISQAEGVHDWVKVLDFGLAKPKELEDLMITHRGTVVGSPYYAPPERLRGEEEDVRSDIYCLGAIGWFMLVGEHVFTGETREVVTHKHLSEEPEPPSESVQDLDVSGGLESLIMRCLSKDPSERPETAWEVVQFLDRLGLVWSMVDALNWAEEHTLASELDEEPSAIFRIPGSSLDVDYQTSLGEDDDRSSEIVEFIASRDKT